MKGGVKSQHMGWIARSHTPPRPNVARTEVLSPDTGPGYRQAQETASRTANPESDTETRARRRRPSDQTRGRHPPPTTHHHGRAGTTNWQAGEASTIIKRQRPHPSHHTDHKKSSSPNQSSCRQSAHTRHKDSSSPATQEELRTGTLQGPSPIRGACPVPAGRAKDCSVSRLDVTPCALHGAEVPDGTAWLATREKTLRVGRGQGRAEEGCATPSPHTERAE